MVSASGCDVCLDLWTWSVPSPVAAFHGPLRTSVNDASLEITKYFYVNTIMLFSFSMDYIQSVASKIIILKGKMFICLVVDLTT